MLRSVLKWLIVPLAVMGSAVVAMADEMWMLEVYGEGVLEPIGIHAAGTTSAPSGLRGLYGDPDGWRFGLEISRGSVSTERPVGVAQDMTTLTANADRTVELSDRWSTHAALGLGVAAGSPETNAGGPVARLQADTTLDVLPGISAFASYSAIYAMSPDLGEGETGAGPGAVTTSLNVGIGFSF